MSDIGIGACRTEKDLADMIYGVKNYSDAKNAAMNIWPLIKPHAIPFDYPEITALLNMIDHHLAGANPDAAPSPEMAALTRARKKLEQAKG